MKFENPPMVPFEPSNLEQNTVMAARLGNHKALEAFPGFQKQEAFLSAETPDELRVGAVRIFSDLKTSPVISVARAEAGSVAAFWQSKTGDKTPKEALKNFDAYFNNPGEDNGEMFRRSVSDLGEKMMSLEKAELDTKQRHVALEVFGALTPIQQEMANYASGAQADVHVIRKQAARVVGLNAELQGVDVAKQVVQETLIPRLLANEEILDVS